MEETWISMTQLAPEGQPLGEKKPGQVTEKSIQWMSHGFAAKARVAVKINK